MKVPKGYVKIGETAGGRMYSDPSLNYYYDIFVHKDGKTWAYMLKSKKFYYFNVRKGFCQGDLLDTFWRNVEPILRRRFDPSISPNSR